MTKFRLIGLSFIALAIIALVGCKGKSKSAAGASGDSDTLAIIDDNFETSFEDDNTALSQETDFNSDTSVYKEEENGQLTPVPAEQVNNNGAFYIVAGSFTLYSNAQKCNAKLKAKGFDSQILEPYGQYRRVTVKQFNTYQEAKAAIPGLRSQIDQTLWILTR